MTTPEPRLRRDNCQRVNSRNNKLVLLLFNAFSEGGIHGRNDMPEDILPKGMAQGSLDHLFFVTLTVSIDYQRDANMGKFPDKFWR